MATVTNSVFDGETGELIRQEIVEVPDPPVDPIQAQIDALTTAILGG